MKTKIIFTLFLLFTVLILAGNAMASFSVAIDSDYAPGDAQAVFNLKLTVNDPLVLEIYDLEFKFDNTELEYAGSSHIPPSADYNLPMGPSNGDQAAGTVNNFTVAPTSFGTPPTLAQGVYDLGSVSFNVLDAVEDGANDFYFDYTDVMFGIFANGTSYSTNNGTDPASVALPYSVDIRTAVPVPSALWLMGAGLLGLAGIRRKNA